MWSTCRKWLAALNRCGRSFIAWKVDGAQQEGLLGAIVSIRQPWGWRLTASPGVHYFKKLALAVVAQWIECCSANQKAAGSIPSQGICLGCGPSPH